MYALLASSPASLGRGWYIIITTACTCANIYIICYLQVICGLVDHMVVFLRQSSLKAAQALEKDIVIG